MYWKKEGRKQQLCWRHTSNNLLGLTTKKVNPREFKVGDLVLRKVVGNKKDPREGKLGPNWEGPYRITSVLGNGAYRLEDSEGKELSRP